MYAARRKGEVGEVSVDVDYDTESVRRIAVMVSLPEVLKA
jgi:hypothetical protein